MYQQNYYRSKTTPQEKQEGADNMRNALRLRLSLTIRRAIEQQGFTHADAALTARTPRTSVTAIVNGNLERTSMDRLVPIAHRLGVRISLRLSTFSL